MKTKSAVAAIAVAVVGALLVARLLAVEPTPKNTAAWPATAQPNDTGMQKMMELAQPGENQKLLSQLAGTWSYQVQMWMAPGAPPMKSSGTGVTKPIMGGRYFVTNTTSEMHMPGPDGKMQTMTFKGMGIDGYDNAKQKFVSAWVDNMGTGILTSEGTYDSASKTFTYNAEEEMMPGTKTKVRELIKITDKDHHTFEWYEERGGQQVKTMEINYTRKK